MSLHGFRPGIRTALATLLCLIAATASAQGVDGGMLPSGGAFVPFRGGPSGGLGLSPSGVRGLSPPPSAPGFMGGMSALEATGGTTLGAPAGPSALRPIGLGGMGRGMGARGLMSRPAAGSSMKAMPRPPVGSYPFRIPPSLRGGGAQAPAMAM